MPPEATPETRAPCRGACSVPESLTPLRKEAPFPCRSAVSLSLQSHKQWESRYRRGQGAHDPPPLCPLTSPALPSLLADRPHPRGLATQLPVPGILFPELSCVCPLLRCHPLQDPAVSHAHLSPPTLTPQLHSPCDSQTDPLVFLFNQGISLPKPFCGFLLPFG